ELGLRLAALAGRVADRDPEAALDLVALRADLADVPLLDLVVEERVGDRQALGLARQGEAEHEVQRKEPEEDPPEAAPSTGQHGATLLPAGGLPLGMALHTPGRAIALGWLAHGSLAGVGHRDPAEPIRARLPPGVGSRAPPRISRSGARNDSRPKP